MYRSSSGGHLASGARDKARLHPDLVEWGALSPDEKQKDVDSVSSTSALMKTLGLTLTDSPNRRP